MLYYAKLEKEEGSLEKSKEILKFARENCSG